jgi:hypothetical protein
MNFNIDTVVVDMLSAIERTVENNWDVVKPNASYFLERDKERLQTLAVLMITGCLTDEKFQSRLDDQKKVIESELNEFLAIDKIIARQSANAAIAVLERAVGVAGSLRGVLNVA